MADTAQPYKSGFDPDIRALFQASFRRAEEIGLLPVLDRSILETVESSENRRA